MVFHVVQDQLKVSEGWVRCGRCGEVFNALEHLFETDPDRYAVTLFNAEPRGNYNRLMLSPVLSGEKTYDEIVTHDDAWYAANNVETRFGDEEEAEEPLAE